MFRQKNAVYQTQIRWLPTIFLVSSSADSQQEYGERGKCDTNHGKSNTYDQTDIGPRSCVERYGYSTTTLHLLVALVVMHPSKVKLDARQLDP